MHVEIVLAALVMVVAVLVAADFFRRTSDAPHEYPAGNEPEMTTARPMTPDGRLTRRGASAPPPRCCLTKPR